MALVLELTPEQEQRLEAAASRKGLTTKDYALMRLLGATMIPGTGQVRQSSRYRVSALGLFADVPTSSEEFSSRKQEEIDLEDRRR